MIKRGLDLPTLWNCPTSPAWLAYSNLLLWGKSLPSLIEALLFGDSQLCATTPNPNWIVLKRISFSFRFACGSKMVTCALLTYCFIIDKGGIWSNFLGGYQGRVLYRIVATTVIILQPRKGKSTSTEGTVERGQGLPRNRENPHPRGNGDAHTTGLRWTS